MSRGPCSATSIPFTWRGYRGAFPQYMLQRYMAFVRVSSLAKLPSGATMEVETSGLTIALCNVGGEIHAIGGICPHQGGPLGHGALHGEQIVCPWHAWEFSCIT